MIWLILIGSIAAALLVTIGYVIGSGMQRAEAQESARLTDERNDARTQRDNAKELAAVYLRERDEARKQLTEADRRLDTLGREIHALRNERTSLQMQLQEAQRPRKRRAGQPVVVEEK